MRLKEEQGRKIRLLISFYQFIMFPRLHFPLPLANLGGLPKVALGLSKLKDNFEI
jgi:hypothetical protein